MHRREIAAIADAIRRRRVAIETIVDQNTNPAYRRGALFAVDSTAKDICTALCDIDPGFRGDLFMRACGVPQIP